ncbi:hypothetical protein ACFE04_024073 [Oxalis oulophora]
MASSYPPLFQQQNNPSPPKFYHSNDPISDIDIPILDLNNIHSHNLEDACRNWGIFRLINHGIPITLLKQLHGQSKRLFAIPFETKEDIFTKPVSYFYGTPALTQSGSARGTQNVNWVEGLNIPIDQISSLQQKPLLQPFSDVLEEYGRHLSRIARTIFAAIEKNLNLDPNKSNSHLSESTGSMRVYRYPHCRDLKDTLGMDVHTDSSVLSILSQQDLVAGLEFFKDNQWINVNPIPNTLVVNLGDLMQAISDDKYVAVKHRVKVNKEVERISICYFVFSDDTCVIQSKKYKPFTYEDFRAQVQEDIKDVGFKVGLDRFRA